MKRYCFAVAASLFMAITAKAQTPPELYGIWRGDDRCIFFGNEGKISIILKEYYGWYYDRAAEPETETEPRRLNAATSPEAQRITANYTKLQNDLNVWEIALTYGKKSVSIIPVAVVDKKLYLNFLLRRDVVEDGDKESARAFAETIDNGKLQKSNNTNVYWQGVNFADSIRMHERNNIENLTSWYETKNALYKLRFWQTDMEYDGNLEASFTDEKNIFTVKKQIQSAGQTYTAASGRGKIIRNVEKYADFPFPTAVYRDADGNKRLYAIGKAYLEKVSSADAKNELMQIVKEANARRKPAPPPLFEKKELDWHWDLINELEKDNVIIQKVRKRQKAFGPRGKETEK
ncbi:MAG: hypothetical protein ACTTKL_09885 [Treponema sp.]